MEAVEDEDAAQHERGDDAVHGLGALVREARDQRHGAAVHARERARGQHRGRSRGDAARACRGADHFFGLVCVGGEGRGLIAVCGRWRGVGGELE